MSETSSRRVSRKELEGVKFRIIDESDLPVKRRHKTEQWLKVLQELPKGKVMSGTEQELGLRGSSVKIMVARFKKEGLLTGNYYVTSRARNGTREVFIVNSAKEQE
jgi:hypothetical protein